MSVGLQSGDNRQDRPAARGDDPPDWNELKEEVSEIAEVAVERGRHFLDSTRHQATAYAEQRKDAVAEAVADFARSLREAGRPFEKQPVVRSLFESVAEGLDEFADAVRSRSAADLYTDLEDAIRRRPGTVAATTMAAGFLLARFIRASAENARAAEARGPRQIARPEGGAGRRLPAPAAPATPPALPQS